MKEYLLTTNEFLEPTVLESSDAYAILLTRLLLLEPGTNPLHPKMGVGLGPKYRYIFESDMPTLQTLIQDQINKYLPSTFQGVTTVYLTIKEKSKYLLITIVADNVKYVYDTEDSNTPIELNDLVS